MRDFSRIGFGLKSKIQKFGYYGFVVKALEVVGLWLTSRIKVKFTLLDSGSKEIRAVKGAHLIGVWSGESFDCCAEVMTQEIEDFSYRVFGQLHDFSSQENSSKNRDHHKDLRPLFENVLNSIEDNTGRVRRDVSINWQRDPAHDFSFTSKQIPYNRAEIKVPWELGRFGVYPYLANTSKNPSLIKSLLLRDIILFVKDNHVTNTIQWSNAMEAGLRIHNILLTYDILRERSIVFEVDELALIASFAKQHFRYILLNSEYSFFQTSNHFACNILGLAAICWFLNLKIFSRLLSKVLVSEIRRNVHDGFLSEGSIAYHRFTTEIYTYTSTWLRATNGAIPRLKIVDNSLREMFSQTAMVVNPLGLHSLVGDSDGGILNHLFFPYEKSKLEFSPYLFAPHRTIMTLMVKELDAAPSSVLPEKICIRNFIIFKDKSTYLLVNRIVESANTFNNTHFHDDHGFVELFHDGKMISIDSGSRSYTSSLAERSSNRSALSHFNFGDPLNGVVFENITRSIAEIKVESSEDEFRIEILKGSQLYFRFRVDGSGCQFYLNSKMKVKPKLYLNYMADNYFEKASALY